MNETTKIQTEESDRLKKMAEALGWRRHMRLGKEVWYDPTGGHVTLEDLPEAIGDNITQLIEECKDRPLRPDDAAAIAKLGNPFLPPSLRYTEMDSERAAAEWKASCGPR